MSSTFMGLNTAYTGLQAANAALNTTANNIANIETKGYSRQNVTTQAAEAIRMFTTYGCVGAGVETIAIERIRDTFYDNKYWGNQTQLGQYEVHKYYMECIEDYYKDDDMIKGFTTIFNEYDNAVQELAKNPDDTKYRQQMIGSAGNLATYFRDTYNNMQKLQDDVNQEIKVNIDRINSIVEEIASLNKQVNVIEMNSGAVANELRDQRDLLVDELSEIVDVEVTEVPVIDYTDVERDTGGTRYLVKACGEVLVDANSYKTLTCVPRESTVKVNQTDIQGLFDIYVSGESDWTADDYRRKGDAVQVYSATAGGKLAGLMQMRDGNNGEYFEGSVAAIGRTVDSDGKNNQTVTIRVTAEHLKDLSKLNLTQSGGIIQIAKQNYYFKEWTYSYTEGSPYAEYTITLDDEKNLDAKGNVRIVPEGAREKEASIGTAVNYQGIPYYLSQMNEWVRLYSQAANDIVQGGVLDDDSDGHALFTGTHPVEGRDLLRTKTDRVDGRDAAGETVRYTVTDFAGSTRTLELDGTATFKLGVKTATAGGSILKDENGVSYEVTALAGNTYTLTDKDGNTKTLTVDGTDGAMNTGDSYYMTQGGNFTVNSELENPDKGASYLATRSEMSQVSDGVEKNDIVKSLIKLRTDTSMMSFRGCAADQYLVNILGDVALNSQRAQVFTENYTYMQKNIQNQRYSVSGVDNDEEAVNLSKFQQQYNIASKMIQVLKEVYDRLILQTGV
ncbi:MAG: flagellar hook-associated protein FlgK [Lachnospiraceae bacterium]|nr:flagellar hook-associated protein FlgK [Lachnospiraceae bacterium]